MKTWKAQLDTDFKESLTLKDSVGTVFDLTGYTPTAEVRRASDGKLVVTTTVTVTNATAGEIDVELTDTEVNTAQVGDFRLDVKVREDAAPNYIYRSEVIRLVVEGRITA